MVSVEYKYPNSLMSSNFRSGGAGNVSLSEGESVMVRCRTDSNPPASVAWRRAGVAGVWSTREEVLIIDLKITLGPSQDDVSAELDQDQIHIQAWGGGMCSNMEALPVRAEYTI